MYKCITITLITSLLTSLLLFIFSDIITKKFLHAKVSCNVIYLVALAIPLISLSSAISGYFSGVRRVYKNAIGQFIEHTFKVFISAILINYYLPHGLEYACFSLILGDLLSELVSFIYIYIIFLLDKKRYKEDQTFSNSTEILRISIPVAITSYIRSGLTTLKQLIIPTSLEKSGSSCAEALSQYGIINGLAFPIITFPDILVKSFASMLVPEFSRYYAKKDYIKAKKITNLLMFLTILASSVTSIILFVFSNKISLFLYKDLTASIYIQLLAPLATFIYIDTIVDSILRGLDAQVGVMIINILDLVISTSFIYFVVPKLGIIGYIISIYLSEIFNFISSLFQLIKILYLNKRKNSAS